MGKRRKRLTNRGSRSWAFWPDAGEYLSKGWVVCVSNEGWVAWKESRFGSPSHVRYGFWGSYSRADQIEELREGVTRPMKRRGVDGEASKRLPHAEYADLLETMPSFAAWMTDATFEDGTIRQGGWISVYARAGSWCATLKDSAEGLQITLNAPSWSQLLVLVEHAIIDPNAPWRPDTGLKGKSKK